MATAQLELKSPGWIGKLRDDQRECGAQVAVIVTTSLPKEVNHLAFVDGVWVCDFDCSTGLAAALRASLQEVANAQLASVGRNEKAEALYSYLHTPQFRQRVEATVRTFVDMKKDLDREKASIQTQWAKRDKQIERVLANIAGMYGELQGLVGGSLPEVEYLQIGALPEAEISGALPPG